MNITDDAIEAAHVAWREQAAQPGSIFEYNLRAALEAAAPILLSHEREESRLAHLDAVVNAQTVDRLEAELEQARIEAWERGRVDGYHHRPNPYRSAGWSE